MDTSSSCASTVKQLQKMATNLATSVGKTEANTQGVAIEVYKLAAAVHCSDVSFQYRGATPP